MTTLMVLLQLFINAGTVSLSSPELLCNRSEQECTRLQYLLTIRSHRVKRQEVKCLLYSVMQPTGSANTTHLHCRPVPLARSANYTSYNVYCRVIFTSLFLFLIPFNLFSFPRITFGELRFCANNIARVVGVNPVPWQQGEHEQPTAITRTF